MTQNIQNALQNGGMETPAPLVSGIISNALFHSSQNINQTLLQIIHFASCTFVWQTCF